MVFPSRSQRSDYHPEFGLLCPSPGRRRRVRLMLVCVVAATAVGATVGLAGTHRPDRDEIAATTIATEEFDTRSAVAPATEVAAPAPLRGQDFCKSAGAQDPVAAFLNPGCSAPKTHHGARAGNKVATYIFGHADGLQ
jgi:hypothetical protein